jgi:hypothetical protein
LEIANRIKHRTSRGEERDTFLLGIQQEPEMTRPDGGIPIGDQFQKSAGGDKGQRR